MSVNKDNLNKIYEAFNTGNLDVVDQLLADNTIDHSPNPMVHEDPNNGKQYLKAMIRTLRGAFPDLRLNVQHMVEENDIVTSFFTMTGTNTGNLGEMPATGKRVKMEGSDIVKFRDGKAVEHWGVMDSLSLMTQLGLLPENVMAGGGVHAEVYRRR